MSFQINKKRRAIVLIIDGCGVGAAPDAAEFGDSSKCNSIANTASAVGGLNLPNLAALGLGNICQATGIQPAEKPQGFFGKLQERSNGKDTQTGHWEMMGIINSVAFPLYPQGFPPEIINKFVAETGCLGILSNMPASGTTILEELGTEHQRTGYPIVYTSGDSVFQIACHIDTVPLSTLYQWCEIARNILQGPHRVGRVIARPFAGQPGEYFRLGGDRRDYAVPPPSLTFLDQLIAAEVGVLGVGKIEDIFCKQGVSHAKHTGSNKEGLELTLEAITNKLDLEPLKIADSTPNTVQFIFTNLVDTDMVYGHRRNVKGYADALIEIDEWIGKIMAAMQEEDLLIISSDHGNDPTAPGTDHTREFVPILAYSPSLKGYRGEHNLQVRNGFMDIAASLSSWFGLAWQGEGVSFIPELSKVG